MRSRIPGAVALVLSLGACGESSERGSFAPVWTMSDVPTVSIGGNDSRAEYQLYSVRDASLLSDGRILIVNGGSSELRYYDESGAYLYAAGGEGDGPGELRVVWGAEPLAADSMLVLSTRPGFTWYSPTGEYVRSEIFSVFDVARTTCRLAEGNWHLLPDASILVVLNDNLGIGGCAPIPEAVHRHTSLLAWSAPATARRDTVAILPSGDRNGIYYRVYGRDLVVAVHSGRVYAADTGGDEILVMNVAGDTLAVLPIPFEARTVPPEARTLAARSMPNSDGSTYRGKEYAYPSEFPRIAHLVPAEDGTLWVMDYPEVTRPIVGASGSRMEAIRQGARWRVLSEGGRVLGEIRTPPGLLPLEIGVDYVLGVHRDELEVEAVRVYELVKELAPS